MNISKFALCSGLNSDDGCTCLRSMSEKLTCNNQILFQVRKYEETISHVLNKSHIEFALVCRHMGHSIKVHEHLYQLPISVQTYGA